MSFHYNDLQEYSKTKLRTFQEEVKSKFLTDESYADHASHMVVDQLVDEIVLEVVAEYHRAVVKGYADHVYPTNVEEQHKSDALNREIELSSDIIEKKIEDIKCPNCTHPINASRFVPHLEKCMCIGRSSSRIASRRIATNSKDSNYAALSDDEDDEDWNSGSKKNKIIKKFEPKKKKEGAKRSNKLINKDFKPGNKNDCRSKEECVDWLTSTKMQLSPISSVRLKKSVPDLDTEAEDTSTTPSPADSNSTSSGSASRRKDRVKSKRKLTKNSRFSEESDSLILR
ncbi:SAGA associated factor 11kDa isoform X2 [Rhodnius prolixus]